MIPPEVAAELSARGVRIAGGIALALLALWLLVLDRRGPATRAFAVVLAALGAGIVLDSIDDPLGGGGVAPWAWFVHAALLVQLLLAAGTLRLVATFPRARGRLGGARGGRLVLAGTAGVLALHVLLTPLFATPGAKPFDYGYGPLGIALATFPATVLGAAGLAAAWRRERDPALRRSVLLAASGFAMVAASRAGIDVIGAIRGAPTGWAGWANAAGAWPEAYVAASLVGALVGASLVAVLLRWGVEAARAREPGAGLFVGCLALGLVSGATYRLAAAEASHAGRGLPFLVLAALATYGLLRHRLLGIDVKARWTLGKSTVAAAFVAAFFLAGEGAQLLFGASNQWIGLLAAGALVFALAPLQRAAERLAEKAVPVATAPAAAPASAAALYRAQVELAWTDGRISPNERVMLRGLRKSLALDAETADAIEHEVETARLAGPRA